uniref:Cell division cycle associated 3 n=1 Tax=Nothobranchius furzeri TaxID=105023 RepID=A0A1A8UXN8_NOTFU|nr:cell division cycle-associated protein 3 [Nothobranchius furzeri]
MGSSESKLAVSAAAKPELVLKRTHVSHLIDPRSPSAGIDRTPIQVGDLESKTLPAVKSECLLAISDPRSPSLGISRTPMREVMRATVGSFARRLGMLFHSEAESKNPPKRFSDRVEEVLGDEELTSAEPLLNARFTSLAEHADLLATPVRSPLQAMGDFSPFVLVEPQVEVEIETEADISLEEAEEARETPLHKRLSMSLITCHNGAPSSEIFEVHHDRAHFPGSSVKVDHTYALPSVTVEPEACGPPLSTNVENSPVQESSAHLKEAGKLKISEETKAPNEESSSEQEDVCTGIRCPSFDTKSPSQLEFKPQWLGKGFGATGLRARGVQGNIGKGGSSPLAVRVAVKNANNENRGQTGKLKQKDAECRSPLQVLKETNSPRNRRSPMKLKGSNQDKPRLGQMDRRVLAVALDKENR